MVPFLWDKQEEIIACRAIVMKISDKEKSSPSEELEKGKQGFRKKLHLKNKDKDLW